MTGLDIEAATQLLEANDYNLQQAIDSFFSTGEKQQEEDSVRAPLPT